ncbi:hypothetical protein EV424DRAFT_1063930 [Suillus variegatus]|nr:hypothetical protein EV424DRAFT_1063930 [Suillus variegatus]
MAKVKKKQFALVALMICAVVYLQDNNLRFSTSGRKDMLIHLVWALEFFSAVCTNSLNLPLMHLPDVTSEVILVDDCRAPVPGTFYFVLCLASLHNGDKQLHVGSESG